MKNSSLLTLVFLGVGMITYFVFHYSSIVFQDLAMSIMYQTDLGPNYMIAAMFVFRYLFLVIAFFVLYKALIKPMNIGNKLEWPNLRSLVVFGFIGIGLLIANIYISQIESAQFYNYMERNFPDNREFLGTYLNAVGILYLSYNITLLLFFIYFIYFLNKKKKANN